MLQVRLITCPPSRIETGTETWNGSFSSDGKTLTFSDFDLTLFDLGVLKNVVFSRK